MLIGSVDNNNSYQNPYVNKLENQQNQSVNAADKTDDTLKTESSATVGPLSEPHDEYIPGDDESEHSAGVYKLKQDEDGKQKIIFDNPDSGEKSEQADELEKKEQNEESSEIASDQSKNDDKPENDDGSEKSRDKEQGQWCTVNTDKVDHEIKELKEEKKQIEQELKGNQNDEDKRKELEQQLKKVESELSIKDNDTYRKQNASYTYG